MNAVATLERPTRVRAKSFLEQEFPNGADAKIVTITPRIAEQLLGNNPDNRNISQSKVTQYASDMRTGKWEFNGESIIIADTGELNDGQHRLLASIEARTSFEVLVCYGVPRKTRTTVDQGKPRGAHDYLAMLGVPNANNIAAMAKMLVSYERSGGRTVSASQYVSNADALEYVALHQDELLEAVRFANRGPASARGLGSPTIFAFVTYLLRDNGEVARQFIEQIITGENISGTDPAYRVRERLISMGKGNRQSRIEAVLRGWIFYRDGKPMQLVKILGDLPSIK